MFPKNLFIENIFENVLTQYLDCILVLAIKDVIQAKQTWDELNIGNYGIDVVLHGNSS